MSCRQTRFIKKEQNTHEIIQSNPIHYTFHQRITSTKLDCGKVGTHFKLIFKYMDKTILYLGNDIIQIFAKQLFVPTFLRFMSSASLLPSAFIYS